ncbi:TetR/AcrR family transcriptional regulator [Streptomyces sp. NPDC017991]|uniref:TetR/AcrR family transcriptional regulator n=1 Tax=Streptomyces sp. NPDC017991 TaxID=3365026 RepID=UPI0037B065AC
MRRDALENRGRIVAAASRCFGRDGALCDMAAVAKEAGVGTATLFRHFPAKQDLFEAVLLGCIEKSAEAVVKAQLADDPFEGLTELLAHFVQSQVQNKYLHQIAGHRLIGRPEVDKRKAGVFEGSAALLRRCQESGQVETDVQITDLFALTEGIAVATDAQGWERPLALVLRGIATRR